jgi:hypothetical protein
VVKNGASAKASAAACATWRSMVFPPDAPLAKEFLGIRVRLRPELRQAIDGFAVYFVCVNHATAALLPCRKAR